MKTLAIRLEDEQHARLHLLAKLSGDSITDLIRTAIDEHLTRLAANPDLSARADDLQATIEREAAEQRAALAQLFQTGGTSGTSAPTTTEDAPTTPSTSKATRPRRM